MVKKHIIKLVGLLHTKLISSRRIEILASHLVGLLPSSGKILDIGSGDGLLAKRIMQKNPKLDIQGIEIVKRSVGHINITNYDGIFIPFPDNSFDATMLVDVLHHTKEITHLLEEAGRVAKNIIIKDHNANTWLSNLLLICLDWIGNKSYNVPLPYNFLSAREWEKIINDLRLKKLREIRHLNIYSFPFNVFLDWPFNFIVNLVKIND